MKEGEFNEDLSNYYYDFFKLKLVSKNEHFNGSIKL